MAIPRECRLRARQIQVLRQVLVRLLAEADVAPLAELGVCHADLAVLQVHVVEGEGDELTHAQPGIPKRVQHNVVAQAEGIRRVE